MQDPNRWSGVNGVGNYLDSPQPWIALNLTSSVGLIVDKCMKNKIVMEPGIFLVVCSPSLACRNLVSSIDNCVYSPMHTTFSVTFCPTFPGMFTGDRMVLTRKGSNCWVKIWGPGGFTDLL